jgi:hypothetical protein
MAATLRDVARFAIFTNDPDTAQRSIISENILRRVVSARGGADAMAHY